MGTIHVTISRFNRLVGGRSESHQRRNGRYVEGDTKEDSTEEISPQAVKALELISRELPLKKAAAIVAELYGYKKNQLYQFGLEFLS